MRLPLTFQSEDDTIRPLRVKYHDEDVFARGNSEIRTFVEDNADDLVLNRPFILRFVGVVEGRASEFLEPDSGPMQRLTLLAPPGEHRLSFVKTARFLEDVVKDPENYLFDARSESKWAVVPSGPDEPKIYVHFNHSARMGEVEQHNAFEGVEAYSGEEGYIHVGVGDWVWIAARLVREDYAFPSAHTRKVDRYPTLLRHRLGLELDADVTLPILTAPFARAQDTILYPVLQTASGGAVFSLSVFGILEAVFPVSPMHCVLMLKAPGQGRLADAFQRTAEFLEDMENAMRNSVHRPIQVYGCVVRDPNPAATFILVHIATPSRFNRRVWADTFMPDIVPTIPFAFDDSDILEKDALLRCQMFIFREDSQDLDGKVWNTKSPGSSEIVPIISPRSPRDIGYIPRPRNAFIIFRASLQKIKGKAGPQALQSKAIAQVWRSMTDDERAPFREASEQERTAHAARYPLYRYKPARPSRRPQQKRMTPFGSPEFQVRQNELADAIRTRFLGEEECLDSEDSEISASRSSSPASSRYRGGKAASPSCAPNAEDAEDSLNCKEVGGETASKEPNGPQLASNGWSFPVLDDPFDEQHMGVDEDFSFGQILAGVDPDENASAYFDDFISTFLADNIPWGTQYFTGVREQR
uniref:HMG box domain-containing protein n=1 Tax=Mycena chlorophos TaxID=658473 RepID=A0ABQ0LP91_MYCCL|nr:predicted protein [Mycena chlorophos]